MCKFQKINAKVELFRLHKYKIINSIKDKLIVLKNKLSEKQKFINILIK